MAILNHTSLGSPLPVPIRSEEVGYIANIRRIAYINPFKRRASMHIQRLVGVRSRFSVLSAWVRARGYCRNGVQKPFVEYTSPTIASGYRAAALLFIQPQPILGSRSNCPFNERRRVPYPTRSFTKGILPTSSPGRTRSPFLHYVTWIHRKWKLTD